MLTLFSTTLHGDILRALAGGPVHLSDLSAKTGGPAQKVLRASIGNLIGLGALERRRFDGEWDVVDNELTPFGRELLFVAEVLEIWLSASPDGALSLESMEAKEAVRALVGGWGSTILRALAVRAFTPVELDGLIASFGRQALERRLFAMRSVGQVKAVVADDDDTTFAATEWLRKGVAPLLAAIRCERQHLALETAPVTRVDVETLLLLAAPLIGSLDGGNGTGQLAVDVGQQGLAGVRVGIERGSIVSCVSKLEPGELGWVGSTAEWLDAMIVGGVKASGGGDQGGLSRTLLEGLHSALFPA